ncbi:pyridoxal-phosphate-dependent aminotransferase family protein [Leptospira weilii]|uniref:pyridoxal-phosphate-dependent aminotransferase family protein n=1 Tax=Leptospira weilii TaxID=28184 RepID=UPI00077499FD|nr:aminotransferase class V-fold PLP-dependent enzyme [Leptospira weilii]
MLRVSLTPAIFHLPEIVNKISLEYSKNPIVPRGPELKPILDRVRSKTISCLGLKNYEMAIFTSSGSGAVAAAMGSCIPEKGILVISNGAYGERMAAFAKQLGQRVVHKALSYGEKPDVSEIAELILRHDVGALGIVHGGTSTCSLNPIAEIGKLTKSLNIKLIVDVISTIFVENIDFAEWNIDVAIGSVNKGLHSNPDLSFILLAPQFANELHRFPAKLPYFDVFQTMQDQKNGKHPFTINPRALLETEAAVDYLNSIGGVPGRVEIYQKRIKILREGYKKLGLKIFQLDGMPLQNIGTAIYIPEGLNFDVLATYLNENPNAKNEVFQIYSAQGNISSTVFRIFNMGEYDLTVYTRFIEALGYAIREIG